MSLFSDLRKFHRRLRRVGYGPLQATWLVGRAAPRLGKPGELFQVTSEALGGAYLVRPFSTDLSVASEIDAAGEYEWVRQRVASAKAVLDLGANVGLSMLLWSHWYPEARLLGAEPDPANADVADRNLALRRLTGRAQVVRAAAAPHSRGVNLVREGGEWGFRCVDAGARGEADTPSVTVPQCLDTMGVERVDLLKVDIEGGEQPLFAECGDWIGRVGALAVETHDPYTPEALFADLRSSGFEGVDVQVNQKGGIAVVFARNAAW